MPTDLTEVRIATIRSRHLADAEFIDDLRFDSPAVGEQAHADRGVLLDIIERLASLRPD